MCLLGSRYGQFDVNNALRGADTLSNYIYRLAEEARAKLNEMLKEPLESGAVCVSPDLWSDNHRKIPYLGMTATFVNQQFEFKVADLCCKPFEGDDQSGKNLLIVSVTLFTYVHFSRQICMDNILFSFVGYSESIGTIRYLRSKPIKFYLGSWYKSNQGSSRL